MCNYLLLSQHSSSVNTAWQSEPDLRCECVCEIRTWCLQVILSNAWEVLYRNKSQKTLYFVVIFNRPVMYTTGTGVTEIKMGLIVLCFCCHLLPGKEKKCCHHAALGVHDDTILFYRLIFVTSIFLQNRMYYREQHIVCTDWLHKRRHCYLVDLVCYLLCFIWI